MPNSIVKDFAKQTGKSEKEIEKLWDKAKEITSDSFGKSEKDFKAKEWSYATGTLKSMLGIKESTFNDFLNSDKDFDTFLMETQTSGNFSGGTPINPVEVIDYTYGEDDLQEKDEKVNIDNLLKDIAKSFGKDKESKMKGSQILKGLLLSDDPKAKEFVDKLDAFTTKIANELSK